MMIMKQTRSGGHLRKAVAAALCVGVALTAYVDSVAAAQRGSSRVVRDHRTSATPVVRDLRVNRVPPPIVRDHRDSAKRKVIRADRNYDKVTGREVVVVNGRRVVRSTRGPIIRDHRSR